MIESKVTDYSIINLNTATLIQNGKPTNSVYPFNDLESVLEFMCKIVSGFKSPVVQSIIASKYYILVDKDCNQYRFEVMRDTLFLYEGFHAIAHKKLKGDSK